MKVQKFGKFFHITTDKAHPYHLVNPSPLPFLLSLSVLGLTLGTVLFLHYETYSHLNGYGYMIFFTYATIILIANWGRKVIKESFLGYHTPVVKRGLKIGFALFIVSEVMFFFGFFWAYFYNALCPSIWIGAVWPPFGITVFNPLTLPLANTLILLTSGFTITYAHYFMELKSIRHNLKAKEGIVATYLLAALFLYIQFQEFYHAPFSIADGIFGSTFFMITGLHGFHVIVGTVLVWVCAARYQPLHQSQAVMKFYSRQVLRDLVNKVQPAKKYEVNYLLTSKIFTGFITTSWYWHFVDVVWIYVYIFLYVFPYY